MLCFATQAYRELDNFGGLILDDHLTLLEAIKNRLLLSARRPHSPYQKCSLSFQCLVNGVCLGIPPARRRSLVSVSSAWGRLEGWQKRSVSGCVSVCNRLQGSSVQSKTAKTLLARLIARLGQQKWTESDTVCRVQAACLVRGGSCSGLSITWKDSAAASRTLVPANKHSGYGRWASCIWKRLKRCTCLFLC
jgi:hypothetical protein